MTKHPNTIPLSIRQTAHCLLMPEFKVDSTDRYPSVSDSGLPPPSAFQLLMPLTSTLTFPKHIPVFAKILRCLDDINEAYNISKATDPNEPQSTEILLRVRFAQTKEMTRSTVVKR